MQLDDTQTFALRAVTAFFSRVNVRDDADRLTGNTTARDAIPFLALFHVALRQAGIGRTTCKVDHCDNNR